MAARLAPRGSFVTIVTRAMRERIIVVVLCAVSGVACPAVAAHAEGSVMKLTSSDFQQGGGIPSRYTCDGQNVSPPLAWEDVPAVAKSLALISDDPDAPMGTWVHWVLWNLPPDTRQLGEGFPTGATLPDGAMQGTTDFGRTGYGGPCPPSGAHRYFFKLYALDAMLSLKPGSTKAQLEAAMNGHILAQAELMGTYQRKGR